MELTEDNSKYSVHHWGLTLKWSTYPMPELVNYFMRDQLPEYLVNAIEQFIQERTNERNANGSPLIEAARESIAGNKLYEICASETVSYRKCVWAKDKDEAKDMAYDGHITFEFNDVTDGDDFTIDEVREI